MYIHTYTHIHTYSLLVFKIGSNCVAYVSLNLCVTQAGLELMMPLPQPPKCWEYRQELPCPAQNLHSNQRKAP